MQLQQNQSDADVLDRLAMYSNLTLCMIQTLCSDIKNDVHRGGFLKPEIREVSCEVTITYNDESVVVLRI